jgi:hypothetical protein
MVVQKSDSLILRRCAIPKPHPAPNVIPENIKSPVNSIYARSKFLGSTMPCLKAPICTFVQAHSADDSFSAHPHQRGSICCRSFRTQLLPAPTRAHPANIGSLAPVGDLSLLSTVSCRGVDTSTNTLGAMLPVMHEIPGFRHNQVVSAASRTLHPAGLRLEVPALPVTRIPNSKANDAK